MDLKGIILFVFDEYENFNTQNTKLKLAKGLYKDVKLIQNRDEFDQAVRSLDDDQEVAFICHVFHVGDGQNLPLRGYLNYIDSGIEDSYRIKAVFVSSGDSKNVMKTFIDQEETAITVENYNSFRQKLKTNAVPVYLKSEILNKQPIKENAVPVKKKEGIFLSHSSKDQEVVSKFRDLILEAGLKIDLNKVKFTSVEDHTIPGGINIPEDLRNFFNTEMGLFIQFISKNYTQSRVCLNEEGAAWCLVDDLMFVSLLLPGSTPDDIGWVKSINKGLDITNRASLLNICQHRPLFFQSAIDYSRLTDKIDEFIEYLKTLN